MAQKIKFSIIQSLFHLFSFLSDKTNGLAMFAKPKILFGSLIVGLTATACSSKAAKTTGREEMPEVLCYKPTAESDSVPEKKDTIIFTPPKIISVEPTCYEVVDPSCYVVEMSPPPEIKADSSIVYKPFEVQKKPEFSGGEAELYKFINENLKYPVTMQENDVQGKVSCELIIEKDGSISNVKVVKSTVFPDGDREAVRIIESMPNWIPGEQNGEKVKVRYLIPVVFKLR